MTTNIVHYDIGTTIQLTIQDADGAAIDVSSASVKYIDLMKPDKTTARKTAVFGSDGTDGIIKYVTVEGDINQTGIWYCQGYVELSDGKFRSAETTFEVKRAIATS